MERSLGIGDVLRIMLKHRLPIAVIFVATVTVVVIVTLRATPIYEAKSTLLVQLGRSYMHRPELGEEQAREIRDSQAVIKAELKILRSHDTAGRVLASLGISEVFPDLEGNVATDEGQVERAIRRFRRKLRAKGVSESDMIEVSFEHRSPEMAATIVNRTVEVFKIKHLETFSNPAATAFLESKVETFSAQLENVTQRVEEFLEQRPRDSDTLHKQRAGVVGELRLSRNRVAGLEQQAAYLEEMRRRGGPAGASGGGDNRPLQEARSRLLELQLEEQDLLTRYHESNRQVADVRAQIRLVEDFIRREERNPAPGSYMLELRAQAVTVESDLRFERARERSLTEQLVEIDAVLREAPQLEERLRRLERERENVEENYSTYLKRLEEARIEEEMNRQQIANITVLEPAIPPLSPVSPKKRINLAVGIMLGIALGCGYAILKEFVLEPMLWKPWLLDDEQAEEALGALESGQKKD